MKVLKVKAVLDRFLERLVAAVMAILTLDVTWQVVTRYILKHPSNWTEELATFLMIWVGLLGAAVALHRRAHLGIDYFVGRLKPHSAALAEAFVFLLILLFSVAVFIVGGLRLVIVTFRFGQLTPALRIPMGFVYLAVPTSGLFFALYSLEFLLAAVKKLGSADDSSQKLLES
ncbi:MAG: TRAP transporter small permease [candidate division KSB1 bacterium]|nr:TRAP transporter small permease [candidate division KSB1 bacterium]